MRKVLSIVFGVLFVVANAQDFKSQNIKITKEGVVNPRDYTPDFNASIKNVEMPSPDGDSYKSFLMRQKIESRKTYPLKPSTTSNKTTAKAEKPIVGRQTPTYRRLPNGTVINVNGGIPNDNSMAISNDGILVSGFNSNIWAYDYNTDTVAFPNSVISLKNMSGETAPGGNYYDPKLIYDPDADRFILTFLKNNNPATNKIFICFSSTNDPLDPWYVYSLPGNPLNNNRWTDYPAVSITEKEFFVTGNLIVPGVSWQVGFDGSVIWQVNKQEGYNNANDITSTLYSQISHNGFYTRNVHPVRGANGVAEKQYFLSNRNFDISNDTLFVMHLTGDQSDPNTELIIEHAVTNVPYGFPPNGQQTDTDLSDPTSGLQTNDARVLGAFLLNDVIQFVGNTVNPSTGRAAIYHGFVTNPSSDQPEIKGNIIASDSLDYGYPNIAFTGRSKSESQAIIGFDFTSKNDFPGVGAIYFNNDKEYSDMQVLVNGQSYIDRLSGTYERWGDYVGIQSKFNSPGTVYTSGYYSLEFNNNSTWVSELISPDTNIVYDCPVATGSKVFPNPTGIYEDINIEFSLEFTQDISAYIYDLNGRLVSKIVETKDCVGTNILTFSTAPLSSGTYVVKIVDKDENEILREKFIKN
jgi:hypothetical protein